MTYWEQHQTGKQLCQLDSQTVRDKYVIWATKQETKGKQSVGIKWG